MTTLEHLLSRAQLVPDRTVPRDAVPPREDAPPRDAAAPHEPAPHREAAPGKRPPTAAETANTAAAEELRALCEALVLQTPAYAVAAFVTDQVPEPRSALVLACVLQLTDTDDGARFWWQYAAGAGQPGAAYCLYLHHLALGEIHTARWWRTQTDDAHPGPSTPDASPGRTAIYCDGDQILLQHGDGDSTTTLLRVLRRLARHVSRPRSAVVTELMTYMPTAVAVGYLREPESELPLPGPGFARKIRALLAAAAERPDSLSDLPARPHTRPALRRDTDRPARRLHRHLGEAATH